MLRSKRSKHIKNKINKYVYYRCRLNTFILYWRLDQHRIQLSIRSTSRDANNAISLKIIRFEYEYSHLNECNLFASNNWDFAKQSLIFSTNLNPGRFEAVSRLTPILVLLISPHNNSTNTKQRRQQQQNTELRSFSPLGNIESCRHVAADRIERSVIWQTALALQNRYYLPF